MRNIIKKYFMFLALIIILSLNSIPVRAESNYEKARNLTKTALEQSTFYNFNMAYLEVMSLENEDEKAILLSDLAAISEKIWTPEVKKAVEMLGKVCKIKDGRTYDETEGYLRSLKEENMDKLTKEYFLGELTGWGREFVFTQEYSGALEAIINAWDRIPRAPLNSPEKSFSEAWVAIEKVENQYSKVYLQEQMNQALKAYEFGLKKLEEFNNIICSTLTKEEKAVKMLDFIKKYSINVPTSYLSVDKIAEFPRFNFDTLKTEYIDLIESFIFGDIISVEGMKFKNHSYGDDIVIHSNGGDSDIDVTGQVIILRDKLINELSYEVMWAGDHIATMANPSPYLYVKDNRVFLRPGTPQSPYRDTLWVNVRFKDKREKFTSYKAIYIIIEP